MTEIVTVFMILEPTDICRRQSAIHITGAYKMIMMTACIAYVPWTHLMLLLRRAKGEIRLFSFEFTALMRDMIGGDCLCSLVRKPLPFAPPRLFIRLACSFIASLTR